MSNFLTILKYCFGLILGIVLFFALGYFYKSRTNIGSIQSIVTKSDTLYLIDTNKHVTVNNNLYATNVYSVTPIGKIDTNLIIQNYFTKRFVADTIKDSLIQFSIYDTVYNNKIINRKTQYRLLQPYRTIINTTSTITVNVSQNGFYVGSFLGFNFTQLQSAGIEANYVTRKLNYGLGYDFKNNAVTGKLLFKISRK